MNPHRDEIASSLLRLAMTAFVVIASEAKQSRWCSENLMYARVS
jgi:hypothetical protein